MLRPFGWRDMPTLYQNRHQGIYLDSAQAVTRGRSLFPEGLLNHLKPPLRTQTWVYKSDVSGGDILGQSIHNPEGPCAHISFLAPLEALQPLELGKLIEQLAKISGEQGAFYLLAEVETGSDIFESLRISGFTPYAQQRIWQITGDASKSEGAAAWEISRSIDRAGIQALCRQITPEQIQQIEARQTESLHGLVCYQGTELRGFARLQYGRQGIWIHPYFDRENQDGERLMRDLLSSIPDRHSRPLYVCARSYQSGLEPALETLGARPGARQTNMVKHLAAQKKMRNHFALPNIEGRPEISMPFTAPRQTIQSSQPRVKLSSELK